MDILFNRRAAPSVHPASMRLQGYYYSNNGGYFVTICAYKRQNLFGEIIDGKMILNGFGKVINDEWVKLPNRFNNIYLDQYMIMPDHFHGIIIIDNDLNTGFDKNRRGDPCGRPNHQHGCPYIDNGRVQDPPLRYTLGNIIGAFKSITTNEYQKMLNTNVPFYKLWQRNYHDRIIRNNNELHEIRQYIHDNPIVWELNKDNIMGGR